MHRFKRTAARTTAAAETAAIPSESEFLRSVLASSNDCIKVLDLDANLVFMSEGGMRVMEVSDFNAIRGCPWPDFWEGPGNADAKAAVAAAKRGEVGRFQGFANTLLGTPRWWDVQVTPIRGADGRPERLLSISRDITELKQAEEQTRLLMEELSHRVKNTFAVVQALFSQTLRGSAPVADMRETLTARLMAFSQANDVLMQGSWTEASLQALVENVAKTHAGCGSHRFSIAGPDVTIGPKAALSMALVLHELGTNAVKYGALSNADGRVEIKWQCDEASSEPVLHFRWQEIGGPMVAAPSRKGFGSTLIERSLGHGFGAVAELAYRPQGVTFDLTASLAGLQKR